MSLKTKKISVLFVCTGNICRSPTAEGVFRHMVENAGLGKEIHIDSAGTIAFHIGESPDPRSQKAAKSKSIDLSSIRARQLHEDDFDVFDFLIALDRSHLQTLEEQAPKNCSAVIRLLLNYDPKSTIEDVPDPYYGDLSGFYDVLNLIESASAGLLKALQNCPEVSDQRFI
ncbi:MAG: phosphotyrosine protein phosphatase [Rhodospirillaceae bacterium]|nr:phosphotyrosine protein phosphatase [Rhodospirillaceae bacterium]